MIKLTNKTNHITITNLNINPFAMVRSIDFFSLSVVVVISDNVRVFREHTDLKKYIIILLPLLPMALGAREYFYYCASIH